jgi:hypothetical protein
VEFQSFIFGQILAILGSFGQIFLHSQRLRGASMVKWIAFDPCEGSTIQGSKLFIKFSFFEILLYEMLRNILIY